MKKNSYYALKKYIPVKKGKSKHLNNEIEMSM